jgi:hypothetical protein
MKMAQIRVMGGAFARVPAEATAFAHRDARVLVAFLAMYGDRAAAPRYEAWAIDAMRDMGTGRRAYVNFLGAEGAAGLGDAYPARTLARLRSIKAKYDPENLFRLNQNIVPAA